jgi:hypothetical protein
MFYSNNGTQFYIKGVAYQSGVGAAGSTTSTSSTTVSAQLQTCTAFTDVPQTDYVDPLADAATCERDIPYLSKLGANAIRTYAIDPTQDHSACMQALDAAGIYVISDLGEPDLSINRESPAWNTQLFTRYQGVIDALAPYDNVIGFFAGNEVTNNLSYTGASAYVKAAVRDSKAYIVSKGYRSSLGVGYAADDDESVRTDVAAYFNCGDVADQIDFWGYNIYEWCGDSNYVESGYINRTEEFENYSVPAFFAEYGCNTQGGGAAGRMFTEVAALYGPQMSPVFSGGFVYEYFEEANDYGLVSVEGSSVSTLADFNAWSTQIAAVSPTGVNSASYSPTNTVGQACPTVGSSWQAAASALPPTPNQSVCSCMMSTLVCTANPNINGTEIASLFSNVCGYIGGKACIGIGGNTATGVYGPYSMCNATEQLSYAFNAYYLAESSAASACSFGGNANIVKAAGAASSCSSVLAAASSSVSAAATATGGAASSSTSKKSEASGMTFGATLGMGKVAFVGFTIVAVLSGAGMVLL